MGRPNCRRVFARSRRPFSRHALGAAHLLRWPARSRSCSRERALEAGRGVSRWRSAGRAYREAQIQIRELAGRVEGGNRASRSRPVGSRRRRETDRGRRRSRAGDEDRPRATCPSSTYRPSRRLSSERPGQRRLARVHRAHPSMDSKPGCPSGSSMATESRSAFARPQWRAAAPSAFSSRPALARWSREHGIPAATERERSSSARPISSITINSSTLPCSPAPPCSLADR